MAADKGKAAEFLRRHAGLIVAVAGLVIAVVALVPTFRATDLADDATANANSSVLSVAGIDMTSTVRLREESKGFGEVLETKQVDAPAAGPAPPPCSTTSFCRAMSTSSAFRCTCPPPSISRWPEDPPIASR